MTHIVILEDHRASRKLLTDVLEQAGYNVTATNDAETGIPLILETLPDLVLMDVHMPATDGLTAIRMLKGDERTAAIPVIAVTALAMEEQGAAAEAGSVIMRCSTATWPTSPSPISTA